MRNSWIQLDYHRIIWIHNQKLMGSILGDCIVLAEQQQAAISKEKVLVNPLHANNKRTNLL